LGEVDDLKYAAAAGAINYGFPVIADTIIPEILPTGITTYEHVVSMPFDEIEGKDDTERAERLVQKCIEIRGVKITLAEVPVPVPYGSAFEGEVVRKADMRVEFGGKYSRCFEYLFMAPLDEVVDGKVEIIGPGFDELPDKSSMDLGIVVEVAGRKLQKDFEPVLERQIHYFVNGASGIQHIGQRDIAWIRISNGAAEKGFDLEHFGKILHARLMNDFGAIVDKVQVKIYTEPELINEWLEKARQAYDLRNKRLANLTDDKVDEFYSCTLCQSFAPDHVCVVSPERLGLCGAYNWLDCKASFSINPTGPNQPIKLGKSIDFDMGYWEGTNDYANVGSHGVVKEVAMYSIMENPMTACGCFECIVMVIPEVNGVMIVSREDIGMTPAGMTFSTLAGIAGGGLQTPGVMGVGKFYLISPKFISADGGFKRVVWMSSMLKETMADGFQAVADREGIPDLIDRIADGRTITTVEELQEWVKDKNHPVLEMDSMQPKEREEPEPVEDVIAQAEAVVEAVITKPEVSVDVEEQIVETIVEETVPEESGEKAEVVEIHEEISSEPPPAPLPTSDVPAERAVDMLRRALIAALAELGGLDATALQVQPTISTDTLVAGEVPPHPIVKDADEIGIPTEKEEVLHELPHDKAWVSELTKTEVLREDWLGQVREVTLGAKESEGGSRSKTVTVGGETAMPFMDFEGEMPNPPAIAVEIKDRRPGDWSELLLEEWGEVIDDPVKWAQAAEEAGADLLLLNFSLTDLKGETISTEHAVKTVKSVLDASGLPLIVFGPGQVEVDNEILVPIADACKGERLLLGVCEDKNYRTIVAAALANDHLVNARTAMDVNLAKQLNILISDMGLHLDHIIMDPTTGALGYGFEYGYSVMERLRLAALQGDSMTQMPMLVTPGEECWKAKESKVGDGVPEEWGDWLERAITWETLTSVMLIESGANIVVVRHPESLKRTKQAIDDLRKQV
jgi:CO dehydrogenase/CO-methylating acetyl-CoA synthase complex beta subunit/CO dehydrogenase/acetyl-CoA synthase delta subunit